MAEEPIPNTTLMSSEYFTANDTDIRSIIHDDPSAFTSSSDLPSSSEFYSARIEKMREDMSKLDVNNVEAKVEIEIEASKVHWSELTSDYCRDSESESECKSDVEGTAERNLEVWKDNLEVFRNLQEQYPGGFFFDNDYGPKPQWWHETGIMDDMDTMDDTDMPKFIRSEKHFAEGGQCQLFHAHRIMPDGTKIDAFVMKVFKEEISLRDLQRQLPTAMLTDESVRTLGVFYAGGDSCNLIAGAQLLKCTRRFAFIMPRYWGDLRKLIDLRMLHNNNQAPPFLDYIAARFMYEIAKGMQGLHTRDIIHRDLSAANVLYGDYYDDGCVALIPVIESKEWLCVVADFECSVGVVGTRFWRAPEILLGIKNREMKPQLFSKQSDVYSFGMTCYEILSGHIPLEELRVNDYDSFGMTCYEILSGHIPLKGLRVNDYDGVIGGTRPSQSTPWMIDLVGWCWHKDPFKRPSFDETVEILEPYYKFSA